MNKAQLIDALAERLGDRTLAAVAVAGLVDVVIRTVNAGERVTITGFGVFEKRARAARTARNPRTGQAVPVQQTDVPVFRPGTLFREVVSGARVLPAAGMRSRAGTARPVADSPAPIDPPASANNRPDTATATTHLSAVHAAGTTGATKAAKAGKATKAGKAAKAAKALKTEPKGTAKAPGKGTTKKAGKKSATEK
ncbi:MAG: HU family DNA-binding protein [Pseudonocardiaceae bacterium]